MTKKADFFDIYQSRLEREGSNYHERLEYNRRMQFQDMLNKSPHYITFKHKGREYECVFKSYRQNPTKNMMAVLCRVEDVFDIGAVVKIGNHEYMFYYLEERGLSGYNKYVVVRMTHNIEWKNEKGDIVTSPAYMYFQEDNMLQNELKSRSRSMTLYLENLKLNFLLMPVTKDVEVMTYMEITTSGISQAFQVTGYDIVSTPGVMYVSLDPTYKRDLTEFKGEEGDDDSFWHFGK